MAKRKPEIPKKYTKAKKTDYREVMLTLLDDARERVISGDIEEFIMIATHPEEGARMFTHVGDLIMGIGMLEIGKQMLMFSDDDAFFSVDEDSEDEDEDEDDE